MSEHQNAEALRRCVAALQNAGARLEATETLCEILIGHVTRQRKDLEAAFAALGRLETGARTQAEPREAQGETWYGPMLR
jgi:hypothetical protein